MPQQFSPTLLPSYEVGTTLQYQRVTISGDPTSEISKADLEDACSKLVSALNIREKYMKKIGQNFPSAVSRLLDQSGKSGRQVQKLAEPTDPPIDGYKIRMNAGVFAVYRGTDAFINYSPTEWSGHDLNEFFEDQELLFSFMSNGPLFSYCAWRLSYLFNKYDLHKLLNSNREKEDQKAVKGRDFYNVHKVDTHIHAAAAMGQKMLLDFMQYKMENCPNDVVSKDANGRKMTLQEVIDSLKLNPKELDVYSLDVHADSDTFQRFDRFNAKYNPMGQNKLREVFMKIGGVNGGQYYAEMMKNVLHEINVNGYIHTEFRMSIHGRRITDWDDLAKWIVKFDVSSANNRWMIQVPRLYSEYKEVGYIKSFQEMLENIFRPMFEATIDPTSHPEVAKVLSQVSGFDSVDDESKLETSVFDSTAPTPEKWTSHENPPYAYYLYYMYSNIAVLNNLRRERGLNTFNFRPHCGESGAVHHLLTGFMLAENVSHGIQLKQNAFLHYCYYLSQIAIATSPLSNNSLFLPYTQHPLPEYLAQGLVVSLSTDDPLQFHYTKEPLVEEYSIASQVFKFSNTEQCELARNSVLMSGYGDEVKQRWISVEYQLEGAAGNNIDLTNVPDIRVSYRYETLLEELTHILNHAAKE